jgi:hypothetical protein
MKTNEEQLAEKDKKIAGLKAEVERINELGKEKLKEIQEAGKKEAEILEKQQKALQSKEKVEYEAIKEKYEKLEAAAQKLETDLQEQKTLLAGKEQAASHNLAEIQAQYQILEAAAQTESEKLALEQRKVTELVHLAEKLDLAKNINASEAQTQGRKAELLKNQLGEYITIINQKEQEKDILISE